MASCAKRRYEKKERVPKTHCKYGHPLFGDNLSPAGLKRGVRVCKTCANARQGQVRENNLDAYRKYQREYKQARRDELKTDQASPT